MEVRLRYSLAENAPVAFHLPQGKSQSPLLWLKSGTSFIIHTIQLIGLLITIPQTHQCTPLIRISLPRMLFPQMLHDFLFDFFLISAQIYLIHEALLHLIQ